MGGSVGLSESQERELNKLQDKLDKGGNLTGLQVIKHAKLTGIEAYPEPTTGMKSYCKKWMSEQVYKRKKDVHSKYLDKGNFCEEWSIEFTNKYLLENNKKNEEYREDEFMCGTADVVNGGIDDIKNSYDTTTFPLFEEEIPNKDYEYQLNGYMHLWNKKTARLIYTLNDLPGHLIEKEARQMSYRNGGSWEDYFTACKEHFTYDDIPAEYKIKIFHLEYNKDLIEEVQERVLLCREYIKKLGE